MTIQDILQESKHPDTLGVELLLAHTLKISRERIFSHPEQKINSSQQGMFEGLFRRFSRGEPVAYLLGKKEFYGLEFVVSDAVLIPRPETEMLVEKVLEYAEGGGKCDRILDVGTGSGALAVTLARHIESAEVVATDISSDALDIAVKNAEFHTVEDRMTFQKADLLQEVKGPFDVVVANLPYIGEEKFHFVSKEAAEFEPHVALFGGTDGLDLYRRFFSQLSESDWKPSFLLGEFGFLQGEEMRKLLNKYFEQGEWKIEKDYASIERIFVVTSASHD